uniref:Uncharacterized protein n=1 Tax=Anopheles minimus TaxID=112268 RepID=A0A182WBU0_9DIPT
MKSIIALVLFIACAAQIQSACVNTNYLYKDFGHPSSRFGLYNRHYYDSLDFYPHDVVAYGAHYPTRSCSCGNCGTCSSCRRASHPYYPYSTLF